MVQVLLDYSAAAYYCRTSACETWLCSACLRHPHTQVTRVYDSEHNGNGFVGWDPDKGVIIVAFAGTDTTSLKNWIDDIDSILTPWPEDGCVHCRVHAGFLATYGALQSQLLPAIQALLEQHPQAPIWITGHSLGAALAVLCMLDLLALSYPVTQTTTFGQPRVGNKEFSSFFNQTIIPSIPFFRLVHHRDPVPHLPPQSLGFHHSPFEVFYSEDESSYVICDPTGEDKHCSNQYYIDANINDHLSYLGVLFGAEELEGRMQEISSLRGVEVNEGGRVAALSSL
ncbi:lipase family protein [Nannochloropsis oceanica]